MIPVPKKDKILKALRSNDFNRLETSKYFKVHKSTFYKWIEPFKIEISEASRKNKTKGVHLKAKPYRPSNAEMLMIWRHVETPNGRGRLLNAHHRVFEVVINGEINFYLKSRVILSVVQDNSEIPFKQSKVYDDIWHQACLIQAADTRIKRDFITGRMTLNDYMIHEKQLYGTINA